jgi:hypothetical protein
MPMVGVQMEWMVDEGRMVIRGEEMANEDRREERREQWYVKIKLFCVCIYSTK